MGKAKDKGARKNQQSHLERRIWFLHQAATLLDGATLDTRARQTRKGPVKASSKDTSQSASAESATASAVQNAEANPHPQPQQSASASTPSHARMLISHLRAVSLKSRVRINAEMKHTICKRCDELLIPGFSCTRRIENLSKSGKKPWADTLLTECHKCGSKKRRPVGASRQLRKTARPVKGAKDTKNTGDAESTKDLEDAKSTEDLSGG